MLHIMNKKRIIYGDVRTGYSEKLTRLTKSITRDSYIGLELAAEHPIHLL